MRQERVQARWWRQGKLNIEASVRAWEQVAETHRLPMAGTVLAWVSKSDTIPIPTTPTWQNPQVH